MVEPLAETELPLKLPELEDYKPSGRPEPPLGKATDWVNVTRNGGKFWELPGISMLYEGNWDQGGRPGQESLDAVSVLAQIRGHVEILDLARDLDRQTRRVKTLDGADAGSPFDNGLAEFTPPDPIRRDHTNAGDHHTVHGSPPLKDCKS